MPPLTIRDVARAAGVHYSTVSLALRNHSKIAPETCQRIQALAREMDYRPHPLVASLMEYVRTAKAPRYRATLGFVVQAASLDEAWGHSGHTYGLSRRHAELLGYTMDFFCVDGVKMTARKLSAVLTARGIQGLVVLADPGTRLDLDWSRFSATALNYGLVEPDLHRVCCHQFQTMQVALRELRRLGYRRIGLTLTDLPSGHFDNVLRTAFMTYMDPVDSANHIPPLVTAGWRDIPGFLRWYRKHRPDVVLGIDCAIVDWLRKEGLDVPGDVGFAGLDLQRENPLWADAHRDLAGIDQDKNERMSAAVDLTVLQLQRNEKGVPRSPRVLMTASRWLSGKTVRRVAPPASGSVGRKGRSSLKARRAR